MSKNQRIKCGNVVKEPASSMSTLQDFINDYNVRYRAFLEGYLAKFEGLSLEEAIKWAALCQDPVEPHHRYAHQRRIPRAVLEAQKEEILKKMEAIRQCRNFEELMDVTTPLCVAGVGKLTLYDITLRISANLGIRPQQIVYTHAGAQVSEAGIQRDLEIPYARFMPEFAAAGLIAWQVEDFLCCYHDQLGSVHVLRQK